jgi:hypothetical protein
VGVAQGERDGILTAAIASGNRIGEDLAGGGVSWQVWQWPRWSSSVWQRACLKRRRFGSLAEIQTLGEQPELILQLQRNTAPFDLTGSPTITLPGEFTGAGLPIGIQLIAPHLHEPRLCTAASAFQSVTGWHRRHPPI